MIALQERQGYGCAGAREGGDARESKRRKHKRQREEDIEESLQDEVIAGQATTLSSGSGGQGGDSHRGFSVRRLANFK